MTNITPYILIVDDEEIIRVSCSKILSPMKYALATAKNAEDALNKLRDNHIDLVLTDLIMPDMDGISLLKKIKEEWPDVEVIIITGYGSIKTAVNALKHGAYDYIEKPFSPDILLSTVERCLEKRRLVFENIRLQQEINALKIENIIGTSREMQKVFKLIATVAPTATTVLITGESGTGKELAARAIHHNSARREQPFIVVDCSTIPENLIESELFGHIRGSFTGAVSTEKGILEIANGGTVFLDEINNIPLKMQVKLLRVLQEKEFRPVGSKKAIRIDIRFIAATNKDLAEMVREGTFREDLYYRLNVFPIKLPPLRNRKEDLPALTYHFLHKYSKEIGREVPHVSADAMKHLISYDWPGNIREFENVIHRAVLICDEKILRQKHILIPLKSEADIPTTLDELKRKKKNLRIKSVEEIEKNFLIAALQRNNWNVTKAAAEVGMQRTNFHALLKKYSILKNKEH